MEKNDLRTELNPFEMLEELLWQDQFELIFPENEKQSELRLVYLMNDAVESFLVFVNAKMTGQYQPDYEGELEAELSREDTEDGCIYVLIVHQGDSVVTIFFEKLKVETHLYRYGDLGHFWVKGYENLRVMEYQIAILRDKYEYLGEKYCTEQERKLAMLRDFPPLNYLFYPAVPEALIPEMLEPEQEKTPAEKPPKPKKATVKKEDTMQLYERLVTDYALGGEIREKMCEWCTYKIERKEGYKEQGMKSLLRQVEKKVAEFGEGRVCDLIEECMSNNWKGIIWDKMTQIPQRPAGDRIQNRVSEVDNW